MRSLLKQGRFIPEKKKRFYLSSNGLKKSEEILLTGNEEHILENYLKGYNKRFETEFNNEFSGFTTYKHYYKDSI